MQLDGKAKAPFLTCLSFENKACPSAERIHKDAIALAHFGWRGAEAGQLPAIHLILYATAQYQEQFSRLYVESLQSSSPGVECTYFIRLTAMIGKSAEEVWGDWILDSPRDADGRLVPNKLPGRHAFPIESIAFKSTVLRA